MKKQTTTEDDTLRYTLVLSRIAHERLTTLTGRFRLTQSEVFEVLLEKADLSVLTPKLLAVRDAKLKERAERAALRHKLTKLTPEQLAALAAMTGAP